MEFFYILIFFSLAWDGYGEATRKWQNLLKAQEWFPT